MDAMIESYRYDELDGTTEPAPGLYLPIEHADMIGEDQLHTRSALNRRRTHPYLSQSMRLVDEMIERFLAMNCMELLAPGLVSFLRLSMQI